MFRADATPVHSISLATSYGEVLEVAEVPACDLPSALRRFYQQAVKQRNAVVTLNGVAHSRNSFLEFVRHFNESAARAAYLKNLQAPATDCDQWRRNASVASSRAALPELPSAKRAHDARPIERMRSRERANDPGSSADCACV